MSSNYTTTMEGFDASGVEYIHSSEIIEFFWFFASFLLLLFTCLRIFKYKENFSIEEKQINLNLPSNQVPYKQPQPQPPQNFEDKQSENQEDKIVLDDIHISNSGSEQHNLGSPQINLEQGINPGLAADTQAKGSLQDFTDNLIFRYMPFLGIVILNIVNFGSYIFMAFMTVFWFFVVLLFNYLEIFRKYGVDSLQTISEFFHLVIIFAMFINYFVNDQSQI